MDTATQTAPRPITTTIDGYTVREPRFGDVLENGAKVVAFIPDSKVHTGKVAVSGYVLADSGYDIVTWSYQVVLTTTATGGVEPAEDTCWGHYFPYHAKSANSRTLTLAEGIADLAKRAGNIDLLGVLAHAVS
jgi:hypothetical protein